MTKEQAKALDGYLRKHEELIMRMRNPYKTESADSLDAKLAAVESEMGLLEYEMEAEEMGVSYGESV